MNTLPQKYYTCHECACGLANDDWSWTDYYESSWLNEIIESSVKSMGLVTHIGETEAINYFVCDSCDRFQHGVTAHVWVSEQ